MVTVSFLEQKSISFNNLSDFQTLTNVRNHITPNSLPTLVNASTAFSR